VVERKPAVESEEQRAATPTEADAAKPKEGGVDSALEAARARARRRLDR
jgi:hypothetical protein